MTATNVVAPAVVRLMKGIEPAKLEFWLWPEVDAGALPKNRSSALLKRQEAVKLYLTGSPPEYIRSTCGLSATQIARLIRKRCVEEHPDGRLYGWRGLVPYLHISQYTRNKPLRIDAWGMGASGALKATFEACSHLDLQRRLDIQILKRAKELHLAEIRKPRLSIHRWFLTTLRQQGYEKQNKWPFNVSRRGYMAICRYIDKVLAENPSRAAHVLGGPAAVKKMKTEDGTGRPVLRPFQRVECDSHKLDGRFVILVPTAGGEHQPKSVPRIWVTVIEEVVSRAVLGYWLSLRREVPADDVLRAIKRALTKWIPRKITFSENAYNEDAGLPSNYKEKFIGACWDEFSVDGAMALKCRRIQDQLRDVVQAKVISPDDGFAQRRSPDDRPYIEAFFRELASRALHRLSNSVGGKPSDKRGRDPDAVAEASQFQLEYLEELLDVKIANYNATPHSSLGYVSPLAHLDFLTSQGRATIRHADPGLVRQLMSRRRLCTVKGGLSEGRHPYVHFENARYSSDMLGRRFDLVGKKIWVSAIDDEDARFAQASTQEGALIGLLHALPPWHRTPHSYYVRSAIVSLANKRLIHLTSYSDPMLDLVQYAETGPGSKLPPHPAYLELRRILQQYAASHRGGEEQGEKSRDLNESLGQRRGAAAILRPLPSRRKAVQK